MARIGGWSTPDRGALFVVSGASGTGKSTLLQHVLDRVPDLRFSVSLTTRSPRPGEVDGLHYHFVDGVQFSQQRDQGGLLEHAEVYGTWYGTPRQPVEAAIAAGQSMVLDIDVQGAAQVRRGHPEAVSIFILPPSLGELRARLEARGTDTPGVIERRMAGAATQLARCGEYDYLVMNRDLEGACQQFEAVFLAELSRRARRDSWVRNTLREIG